MDELTKTQSKVLGFILKFKTAHGYPPSRVEISNHFRWLSYNSATCHLNALVTKGRIRIAPKIARGIEILK